MQNFIRTADRFGKLKRPFLFLIDFERRKPLICPLEEAHASGLFFDFFGKSNIEPQQVDKPFEFEAFPPESARYRQGFELVQKEIRAGNSYLLNLTYPSEIHTNYSLKELFFAASAKYKLWFAERFVCFSPEPFVRIRNNKIYAYPMKGTISADEPNALQTLMESAKEFAEHNTIVDLIRNDLALVAENIQVTKYRYPEKLETHRGAIYQTSSEICGETAENWRENIGSILAKLLPAGSVSGAPKEKTLEIIRRAEAEERGYYSGVFGLFDGEALESAVAIRYIEQADGRLIFRSGGGITAQSDLYDEYRELAEKAYVPISVV